VRTRILTFYLLGIVALFADMVYEGGRSILGPYFSYLHASILVAGVVSLGDVIGYIFRGIAGIVAYRLGGRSIILLLAGYGLNITIPLLALTGSPITALILILLERAGKGIRAPVKDSLIAGLTEDTRIRGIAYGVHEVMDQAGAILGPFIVAYSLGSYNVAYKTLAIPYIISMAILALTLLMYHGIAVERGGLKARVPWLYIFATSMPLAGFMNWALLGYIMANNIDAGRIAVGYSIAMVMDTLLAIPVSVLYLKLGSRTLLLTPLTAGLTSIVAVYSQLIPAAILWGATMVQYETIVKRGLADRVEGDARTYSFGIHGLVEGMAFTLGNIILSVILHNVKLAFIYIIVVEVLSTIIIYLMASRDMHEAG